MMEFLRERKNFEKFIFIGMFFVIILGYVAFRTKDIISGPKLSIVSPQNGATIETSSVKIIGTAKNVAYLSLNDMPIYSDEKGNFEAVFVPLSGYNILSLKGKDKFGKVDEKRIVLVGKNKLQN